jgi:3-phosphoglycerate kinase
VLIPITLPKNHNFSSSFGPILRETQLKTIRFLLNHSAKVFLLPSYLQPPKNEIYYENCSTLPFVDLIQEEIFSSISSQQKNNKEEKKTTTNNNEDEEEELEKKKTTVVFIPAVQGTSLPATLFYQGNSSSVFLFQNLLFYSEKEMNCSESFSQGIAKYFDLFVYDDPMFQHDFDNHEKKEWQRTASNWRIPSLIPVKAMGFAVDEKNKKSNEKQTKSKKTRK